jgi:hypothetical protein
VDIKLVFAFTHLVVAVVGVNSSPVRAILKLETPAALLV